MTINADAIARRYALRPGCRFIGFRVVGLAVFSMNLRALALVPRDLPPIDEFLLRFLGENIQDAQGLAGLLGLDADLVQDSLIELRRQEFIDILDGGSAGQSRIALTAKGTELLKGLKQSTIREITLPSVLYHGLLRRPVQLGEHTRRQYLKPKETRDAGLELIRAMPNRYPHPEEFDIAVLDRVVKEGTRTRVGEYKPDIIAVRSVLSRVHTVYEPAIMLEYETEDEGRERQVAFAVEGQLRDDYEEAFANAARGDLLMDILTPQQENLCERIERVVPIDVIERLGRYDDVEELTSRLAVAQQKVEDANEILQQSDRADTRQELRKRIEILEAEKNEIQLERNARKVKLLWTPEIRAKLWEALDIAKDRILILSGFVSSEVVNQSFEEKLRAALLRGVKIWIGYGFDKGSRQGDESRKKESWRQAEEVLHRLRSQFPLSFTFRDVGRSHEKRLICDNLFTFGGSFNLLSFSGEVRNRQGLRHEGADLIEDSGFCDEIFERYISLFFS